ncbi:hypothetical protein M5C72_06775 [Companilactobacillus allii]|uniref:MacB-like periplasmic core domain-containing protein n=1 Tax=Companilactobacillus allii TaxID=1847728 RepID=A0A1P8Q4L1_9LACO|nr:hypothetical protein [Companilactobacillus allii]APX72802.1 hypothetical protein BTM29_09675 [Companilactobacillus allii]USQ67591.1 hypothetical protein M5C72_06775 [Companilactobacillus allii]
MKKIISSIIILIAVLLTGVSISKSDSIKYNNTMNRLGMSDKALVLHTKSKKNLISVVKELDNKKLSGYQIIFFEKDNSDMGFIYSHKKVNKLPVTSGRYFSQSDFSSQIPFAVQGKSSDIKNYKPQSQEYIKVGKNYVSAIGNIGFNGADTLNSQTLISLSPNQPKMKEKLNDVIAVLDGNAISSKESYASIKKVLHVTGTHRYSPQSDDFNNVESDNNGELYMVGIVLLFALAIAMEFYILIPLRFDLNKSNLTGDLKNNYRNGLLLRYLIYTLVPYVLGYIFVSWRIVIISHSVFNIFMVSSAGISILIGIYQIFFVKKVD